MATLRRQLLALFCVAVGVSSEGICDCQAVCTDFVRDQREENARLRAELRALHHRISQLTTAAPHAWVRRAASAGDACDKDDTFRSDEEMEVLRGCRTVGHIQIKSGVTSLAALQSLETAKAIKIEETEITSLADLGNLWRVDGSLSIWRNLELESLAGLESLQTARDVSISGNIKVKSMVGLDNLRSAEDFFVHQNPRLQSLDGLDNLTRVATFNIMGNGKLVSLLALQRLQTVDSIKIEGEGKLESLAGLENVASVETLKLIGNYALCSFSGLNGLQTAHSVLVEGSLRGWEEDATCPLSGFEGLHTAHTIIIKVTDFRSLDGFTTLTSVVNLELFFNRFRSIEGLKSLQTAHHLTIMANSVLESLAGLERLTSLQDLKVHGNSNLRSLSGLEGLQTALDVNISGNRRLPSLHGLGNLLNVRRELVVRENPVLRTLEGLERVRYAGKLTVTGNNELVSLYPGLQNLEEVSTEMHISLCKLSSLYGLSSLHSVELVTVQRPDLGAASSGENCKPMQFLGGPFAAGAAITHLMIDADVWPKCVTPLEYVAVVSPLQGWVGSTIPEPQCETRELVGPVKCARGQHCAFSTANFSIHSGEEQSTLLGVSVSDLNGGCGVCPGNHMQSKVGDNGLVDFGYGLRDEQPGRHSLCSCNGSDLQGPVGELFLRGARMRSDPANCTRGHACRVKLEGEGLERTDHVVILKGKCSEGHPTSDVFAAHWNAQDEYLVHNTSGWYSALPDTYLVCWSAPCTDESVCEAPGSTYLNVGEVELFGPTPKDHRVVLGENFSAANVGLGVSDGDRMRLMRRCGEENENGMEALEAISSYKWFHFGPLTADRVQAGRQHLCWCQEHKGVDAVECTGVHDFIADSGVVDILCLEGQKLNIGSGLCEVCPAGRHQPKETVKESCLECPAGQFSLEGARECTVCEDGTVAEVAGSSQCTSCRGWQSSVEATTCSPNPQMLLLLASFPLSVGALCWMFVRTVRKRLSIVDVSLDEDRTLVTIAGSHGLSNFSRSSFPVTFSGTGHPGLDVPSHPFLARVKDAARLELFTAQGSIVSRLDTSMGELVVTFPHDLYHQGWPLPAVICLPGLFFLVVALGILVTTADMAVEGFLAAAAAALVCTAAFTALRWRPPTTPLRQRLPEFKKGLLQQHLPTSCSKGPDRAVTAGQLHKLLESFRELIRDRTAYYLTSNLLVPLTQEEQLSYAELVGPGQVQWFVSHFWGTAFTHFCASLHKHAETVSIGDGWKEVRYWVCFCSNNQHHIKEELGSGWQESSFYVTLRSGHCQGTCMVLDDQALPLTRIWCIFELLQTVKLQRSSGSFQGLLFCTSGGVLNTGNGSVEVAMALAKKVADINLSTAQATSQSDADMIRAQVINEMGSFEALNRFTCQEVHSMLAQAQRNANQRFAGVLAHLEASMEEDPVAAV